MPEEPLLEPYLSGRDIEIRRFGTIRRAGRSRSAGRTISLATNFRAPHQLQNTLAALTVCDVARRAASRGGHARGRVQPAARRGDRARRRGDADQRLLQREPGVDDGGARAPRGAGRGPPASVAVLGEMAELGEEALALPPRASAPRSRGPASPRSSRSARSPPGTSETAGRRRDRPGRRRAARRPRRCPSCSVPATSCSSRARGRWDSKRSRRI